MRYTLRQLEVFLAAAHYENITRAAGHLAMSQSAASGALKELEQQFDVQLFDRVGKRLQINELGRALRPEAESLLEQAKAFEQASVDVSTLAKRVERVMLAAFGRRRIVVFSGGALKGAEAVYDEAKAIRDGGGNGSIIGRNTFQRSREDAMAMLERIVRIYQGKE